MSARMPIRMETRLVDGIVMVNRRLLGHAILAQTTCSRPRAEQFLGQLISGEAEVIGYIAQDAGQRAHPERIVIGNGDMVLAVFLGSQPDVGAFLPRDEVATSR